MSEIPQDIMEVASNVACSIADECLCYQEHSEEPVADLKRRDAALIIARAIMAERERCAKLASEYEGLAPKAFPSNYMDPFT